jgi:hypothetical protein
MARARVESPVPPREARAALFMAAGRFPTDARDVVTARCAGELGVSPAALLGSLFADLPSERIAISPPSLDPGDVVLRANLALAQGLLARAYSVRIAVDGNARAVVRHAALRGLICSVMRDAGDDLARIELSGPFALFQRTLLYGRALGAVMPVLAWTRRFKLEATCDIRGRRAVVTLATGDPIFPSSEPRRFDSRLEERFARDFARLAPDWAIVREPEPIPPRDGSSSSTTTTRCARTEGTPRGRGLGGARGARRTGGGGGGLRVRPRGDAPRLPNAGHGRRRGVAAARGRPRGTPLMTASTQVREIALQHGLRFYVPKPLRSEDLLDTVEHARSGS